MPQEYARCWCEIPRCGWDSGVWPTQDLAGWRATWHVYEDHRLIWEQMFGNTAPTDPDPRRLN